MYVGRPSKWGNIYSHLPNSSAVYKVATREEAVEKFRTLLLDSPTLVERAKAELKGKDLVCWCAPLSCHADILLEVANG